MYLFLDSSSFIHLGILNEDFSWAHHEIVPNKKGSQVLHSIIYDLLSQNGLKISDIKTIFLANGPGSYTGIRVAEGVCQILEIGGAKVASFYHFEIPSFCGINDYSFYAEAFKGEIFCYKRRGKESDISFLAEEKFLEMDHSGEYQFSLNGEVLDIGLESLYDLFKNRGKDIFSQVLKRSDRQPPYYFRSVEKEFKPVL